MSLPPWKETLTDHLANLRMHQVLTLVAERLDAGDDPLTVTEVCQEGLRRVGERYERQEYFLAGLIMAGEIFRGVVELVQPQLEARIPACTKGRVLLGTVQGDIHDIGKNLLLALLRCHGFDVQDLGVDVSPERFVQRTQVARPDVVGLSGLLTTTYDVMRETVQLLRRPLVPEAQPLAIMIGGGLINDQVCEYVGADFWAADAMEGVRFCQGVVGRSNAKTA